MKNFVIALASVVVVAGCGADGASPDDRVCAPGASSACACNTGASGAQACLADGSGFAACSCSPTGTGGQAGSPVTAAPTYQTAFIFTAYDGAVTTDVPASVSACTAIPIPAGLAAEGWSCNVCPRAVAVQGRVTQSISCTNGSIGDALGSIECPASATGQSVGYLFISDQANASTVLFTLSCVTLTSN